MSIEKAIEITNKYNVDQNQSQFQMANFIIGKEPTINAKMWQTIREIESRLSNLKAMKLQIAEVEDNIELIDIKTNKLDYNFKRLLQRTDTYLEPGEREDLEKELAIEKRKYARQRQSLLDSKEEVEKLYGVTESQLTFFVQAFEHLLKRGHWKDFDDPLAQAEYWNAKLADELAMRLSLQKPIDIELGRLIASLPNNLPVKNEFYRRLGVIKNIEKDTNGKE